MLKLGSRMKRTVDNGESGVFSHRRSGLVLVNRRLRKIGDIVAREKVSRPV